MIIIFIPYWWLSYNKLFSLYLGIARSHGVASDVVKAKGEDPATPGPLKRNDPGTVTIPQYWVNKTKQHTLMGVVLSPQWYRCL